MITNRAIEQFDTILRSLWEDMTATEDEQTKHRLLERYTQVFLNKHNYIKRNR